MQSLQDRQFMISSERTLRPNNLVNLDESPWNKDRGPGLLINTSAINNIGLPYLDNEQDLSTIHSALIFAYNI